jgi:flagellar motor switch protein FliM
MEKLLDQEQINAMFKSARASAPSVPPESGAGPQLVVSAYDMRQSAQLTTEQVRCVTSLHEGVGRSLSDSLGAYLRVLFEADVVSVEQLSYAEFLGRIPDTTYLCSLVVAPMNAVAVLQMDLQIGFPLIDLLLGGQGEAVQEVREATEIEEQLLEGIVGQISRELDRAWSQAGIQIKFDERQLPASIQRLFSPGEKTLVISFELRMSQVRGNLNLAFPAVVANTLMRKLLRELPSRASNVPRSEEAFRELLLECEFDLSLRTPQLSVLFSELVGMETGSVLQLPFYLQQPLILGVGDQDLFAARPVRTRNNRGAQLCGGKELPMLVEQGSGGQ